MEAVCVISRASFIVIILGRIDEINSATVIFINAGGRRGMATFVCRGCN